LPSLPNPETYVRICGVVAGAGAGGGPFGAACARSQRSETKIIAGTNGDMIFVIGTILLRPVHRCHLVDVRWTSVLCLFL
jgi:hypothetical protein